VKGELQGRKLKCPHCETKIGALEEPPSAEPIQETLRTRGASGLDITQASPVKRPRRRKAQRGGDNRMIGGVLLASLAGGLLIIVTGLLILRPWQKPADSRGSSPKSGDAKTASQQQADAKGPLQQQADAKGPLQQQGEPKVAPPQAGEPPRALAPFGTAKARELQADWAKYLSQPVEEVLDLGNGVTLELVLIPPGKFQMGAPAEEQDRSSDEQLHEVEITRPFYLGKYEVTQEQYQQVMGTNPSNFKGKRWPVEKVSWQDAQAFCKELSGRTGKTLRLPTEAEWEYACRAGTTTAFHFGKALNGLQGNNDGNYPYGVDDKGPYRAQTCQVGIYAPNPWGLYDMHGNVWEWCADWYSKDYSPGLIKDPQGQFEGDTRVLRGGSWFDPSRICRSAFRGKYPPATFIDHVGFRIGR
jgi:formylglycine-generating enzyme required for sulfatase activity